ncbi:MAG TPA: hypothetical protein VEF04_02840, partial [Blastocatellia bacterium]|nr:hypothetical protein [Blastocatellia bacterium]
MMKPNNPIFIFSRLWVRLSICALLSISYFSLASDLKAMTPGACDKAIDDIRLVIGPAEFEKLKRQSVSNVIIAFKRYAFTEEQKKELVSALAPRSPLMLAQYLTSFELQSSQDYFEALKLIGRQNLKAVFHFPWAKNLSEEHRLQLGMWVAGQDSRLAAGNLFLMGLEGKNLEAVITTIAPDVSALVLPAFQKPAALNPIRLVPDILIPRPAIPESLKDQATRFEALKKAAAETPTLVLANAFNHYRLSEEQKLELAKIVATADPVKTIQFLPNLQLKDQKHKLEIFKLLAPKHAHLLFQNPVRHPLNPRGWRWTHAWDQTFQQFGFHHLRPWQRLFITTQGPELREAYEFLRQHHPELAEANAHHFNRSDVWIRRLRFVGPIALLAHISFLGNNYHTARLAAEEALRVQIEQADRIAMHDLYEQPTV